jgi:hypothetical protein
MNESINKKFPTGGNLDNKSDMALSNKKVKDATEQFDKEWSQIITRLLKTLCIKIEIFNHIQYLQISYKS